MKSKRFLFAAGMLQNVSGLKCAAGSYACMTANDSGWIIVRNSQVADGSADHCHMRASGDCFGSQNSLDANWNNGAAQWLTGFTTK